MLCMLTHYYSQGAGDMEQRGKVIYVTIMAYSAIKWLRVVL